MRVLVISHLYPSRAQPGLGPFIHEQVVALRAHGVDARVVCGQPFLLNSLDPLTIGRTYREYRRRLDRPRWETHDGLPVVYLPYLVGGFFRVPLHGTTYRNALLHAGDWLKATFDYDLIHAHTAYLDGGAALALSRRFDVPYLLTEHTGPFHLLTDHWYVRRQTVAALRHARKVFCVSTSLADEVRAVLPDNARDCVEVLHNGVDAARFRPPLRWLPDPRRPRLLSVIALEENKNPQLLLEAFRRLRADIPGARLAIVGDGPLRSAVAVKVEADGLAGAVDLLGYQPRDMVAGLMRDECDVFVLPSNSETFGVVLIEALACGKPIVATDCGGPRDIVSSPAVGVLCEPRNPASLYNGLLHVTRNLPHYRPEAIRQHARRHFDYGRLAARLAGEYAAVLPIRMNAAA